MKKLTALLRTASINVFNLEEKEKEGTEEVVITGKKFTFNYPQTHMSFSTNSDSSSGSDSSVIKIFGIGAETANKMIISKETEGNFKQKIEIFVGRNKKDSLIFSGYSTSITYVESIRPYVRIEVSQNEDLFVEKRLNVTLNETSTRKEVAVVIAGILGLTPIWFLDEKYNITLGKRTLTGTPKECLLEVFPVEDGIEILPNGDKIFFYDNTYVFKKEFILNSENGLTEYPSIKNKTNYLIKSILIPEIDAMTTLKIPVNEIGEFTAQSKINFRKFRVLNYSFNFEDTKDSTIMECEEIV